MRKLIKKSLACCLVVVLALTAMVGAFTVSAESIATVTADTVEVANGTTSVTVPVTIEVTDGFYAAYIQVASEFGALTAVSVPADADYDVTADGYTAVDLATGKMLVMSIYGDSLRNDITEAVINCTFTADAAPDAGTYAVTVTCPDVDVPAADWAESVVALTPVAGAITVAAAPTGPVLDSNLVFYRTSLAYGTSSLELNFRIANTVLDLYNNVEVVIVPQKYDMTTLNLVEEPAEIVIAKANLAAAGTKYMQYTYTDIQLYELGLNIDYMLRAYDAEGNLVAVSETYSTSAAAFLKKTYSESDDAKLRTLIADTLVVGQESVDMMKASYPNSDLADAVSIIEDFDTSEATPSIGECNDVDSFVSYNTNYGTDNTFTHYVRKSVSIGKVPFLAIRTKDADSALDLSKLSYHVTYTSLNLDSTTGTYEKTFTNCSTKSGQFITFNFEEIGLGDGDKDIFIEVLYDGDKVYDMTYSMETYLSSQTSNASVGGVCTALLKLGAAFRAYATK